jgi:osmotically-inducible protein OsmY
VKYDVQNQVVTLKGEVNSQSKREQAEKVASSVANVQQVVIEVEVKNQRQVVNEIEVKNQKATSSK